MQVTRSEFDALVRRALEEVPPAFEPFLAEIVVEVEDRPDRATCQAVGVEDPEELLGMYHGTPLTDRNIEHSPILPDRITIYQRNLEKLCRTPAELVTEIRVTVLHEIGHHFGLEEEDLGELGYE